MNRANQQALVHVTNNTLITIRNAEIAYFNQFFATFGTQAALIAGFTTTSLAMIKGQDATCNQAWVFIFWFSSVIAFVGAMHILLCVIFITVFGQGLALRGPTGSMAKAVDGMIIEQRQIMTAYHVTFIAFGISHFGKYGIMMNFSGSLACTALTIVGMSCWYHYCSRIYNRFSYDAEAVWRKAGGGHLHNGDDDDDDDHHDNDYKNTHTHGTGQLKDKTKTCHVTCEDPGIAMVPKESFSLRKSQGYQRPSFIPVNLSYAGYLSVEQAAVAESVARPAAHWTLKWAQSSTWTRLYVVIVDNKLFYYNDRKSYEEDPQNSCLRKRPVMLENYALIPDSLAPPFLLTLSPEPDGVEKESVTGSLGNAIEFRCDSAAVMANWIEILSKSIEIGKSCLCE